MSNIDDMVAAAAQPEAHDLYRDMVQLECDSSFAFQGSRWLGDVAPHLLSQTMLDALQTSKARAAARVAAEKSITRDMLYIKGWPTRMLSDDEAEILADVRRRVSGLFNFSSNCLDRESIHARYAQLIADRSQKEAA